MTKYFEGFKFPSPYKESKLQIKVFVEGTKKDKKAVREGVYSISLPDLDIVDYTEVNYLSTRNLLEILRDFEETLDRISQGTGEKLSMERRELLLVDLGDLKPKTKEEVKRLVKRYGKYVIDGGNGDCIKEDENFRLRVGVPKTGSRKDLILDIAAHEYGHTLEPTLDSAIFEELKAFAFASLFERFYEGVVKSSYNDQGVKFRKDRPHTVARHKLTQLLQAGVPEEAIIAHLTGEKFGRFNPADYFKFIRTN